MNINIEIGASVLLSNNTRWDIGEFNPVGMDGIVIDGGDEIELGRWVVVRWNNGIANSYFSTDEDLVEVVR